MGEYLSTQGKLSLDFVLSSYIFKLSYIKYQMDMMWNTSKNQITENKHQNPRCSTLQST